MDVPTPSRTLNPDASADGSRVEERLRPVESWFSRQGWTPWEFQRKAWRAYLEGQSGLIQVPTGAGKTYAAFLGPIAEMAEGERSRTLRILYVSPLRAVARDIELALRTPAAAIVPWALVESRTGDTPAAVRAKQRERLPHVLITTPESLTLILTREYAAELLSGVRCVIVDEWHELIASKRGTQTELALARLRRFSPRMRAWALSATLPNTAEAARAVVGVAAPDPVIVRANMPREVMVDSVIPSDPARLPPAGHLGLSVLPDVLNAIDPAVSTLLFTNTRSQAERWFYAIRLAKPEWEPRMALHHGSIDREERERVESGLKNGEISLVVATSSLDLGVDFAPVERVFQIGSPKGIARLMQRAGRAGHRPLQPCRITCVPTYGLELFEIEAVRAALASGRIEPRTPMDKPLDVLAQHMVSCALGGGFTPDELFAEVRSAWSYRGLTRDEFEWTLSLVREGGGTLRAYPEYHRVAPIDGRYRVPTARLATMHRLNVGTITGEGTLDIRYLSGRSLGRIEENFVAGLREGEKFVFAGKVLAFAFLKDLVAYVRPARGKTTYTPIWAGTKLPISEPLAESIREAMERAGRGDSDSPELRAAAELVSLQRRLSLVPGHDEILIELCESREGHHLFVFPFGGRLAHAGLASVVALRLARSKRSTFSLAVNDYGFELVCPERFEYATAIGPSLFAPGDLDGDTEGSVNLTELAKLRFRDVARVSGLVNQNYPGTHKTARQSQAGATLIFDVLSEFDPGNLLLHQARREVMDLHFERGRLRRVMERMAASPLRIVKTSRFTPLSFPLVVERQAGSLTTEGLMERVDRMRREWADSTTAGLPQKEEGLNIGPVNATVVVGVCPG